MLPAAVHVTELLPDSTTTSLFSIVNGRLISPHFDVVEHVTVEPVTVQVGVVATTIETRKPCYRKDDRAIRPVYKLFTLILFTLTATILCTDFDSERI